MVKDDPIAVMASFFSDFLYNDMLDLYQKIEPNLAQPVRDDERYHVSKMSAEYASKLGGASMPVDMEGGKKKRKKRVVDPNAPKRPQSAYVKYLQDTRPKVVNENPDLKQTEIMAKIGNLWSALPEAKKKKYHGNYEKELKKWEKENKKYLESKGLSGSPAGKAPKTPEKKKSDKKTKAEKKKKKPVKAETPKKGKGVKRKASAASEKKGRKKKA